MLCPNCRTPLPAGAVFCFACGTRAGAPAPAIAVCAVHPANQALATCPRCGTFACAECLLTLPTGEQVCRACEAKGIVNLPWDLREEQGTLRAFFRTCWAMISRPNLTLAGAGARGSVGSSALFAFLCGLCGMFGTAVLYGFMFGAMPLLADPSLRSAPMAGRLMGPATGAFTLGFGALWGVGTMFVMGSIEHLLLRLFGAQPQSWPVTIRAYSLSLAPSLLGLVPYCGIYIFPIWSLVLRILAYRALHPTRVWQAVLAVLAPLFAMLCLVATLFVAMYQLFAARGDY